MHRNGHCGTRLVARRDGRCQSGAGEAAIATTLTLNPCACFHAAGVAYAHYGTNMIACCVTDDPPGFDVSFLSTVALVRDFMGDGWSVMTMIFGIAMIAST